VVPVTDGTEFMGYKLSPGIDSALFSRAGLKRGDTLIEVNGVRLDSPKKALTLIGSLTFDDDLELKVIRAGETQTFKYSF
jgi:general secretion pathway protein C